ncbi:glycosyltransferase family 4 protein [bacterium]|nr:glycosyltransferase family 4 protein [bacterium]
MVEDKLTGITVIEVITRLDRGGSAEMVLDLVRELSRDGVRVVLITGKTTNPQTDLDVFAAQYGVDLIIVPQLVREISPLNDGIAFLNIRRIIKRIKPDIVHTHTSKAGIVGRFAAWSADVGHIVHTPHGHIFYGYYNPIVTWFFVLAERLAARITEKITTLTRQGLTDHVRKGIAEENKFTVIPGGVDVRRFKNASGEPVRSETGFRDRKIVGWAGRIDPIKNCSLFIEAASIVMKRKGDVCFIVAGDGKESDIVKKQSDERGLSGRVVFLGNRSDMPEVMAAFDIFVLSSHNEGFGRVLVEAMAAGAVPVSVKVGGTSDVIEDGVSGILVPPENAEAIADAVCGLLEDNALYNRLRDSGKKRADLFDSRAVIDRFEELYAGILGL